MTRLGKGLIITAVILVLGAGVVIAGGIYWVASHKDAWLAKGKATINEGKEFGKGTDQEGCVAEGAKRHRDDPSISNGIAVQLFMQGCLRSSRATPGFCDNVPRQTEFVKSAQWRLEQCSKYNLQDNQCAQVFTVVQQYCERPQQDAP